MGVDLRSDDASTFRFSPTRWSFYLNIAENYGWIPERTKKPKGFGLFKKWSGVYDTNDGQYVNPADAKNLAKALNIAISSLDINAVASKIASQIENAVKNALGGELPSGYSVESDVDVVYIKDFIDFCEKGGFYIE